MTLDNYSGWSNWETWNVSLWIQNDEGLYSIARDGETYADFVEQMAEFGEQGGCATCDAPPSIATGTPDGVAWNNPRLDTEELDQMIRELSE